MALFYRTNYIPSDFYTAIYQWKEDLKTNGWVVHASGTGTGGTASTGAKGTSRDLIASPSVFSARARAWLSIHDAASGRSFVFQNFQRDDLWRIKYSASAGFVGGSPAADVVPSATDEVVNGGSGTDASPGSFSLFPFNAAGTRRWHTIIDPADNSFIAWSYPANGQMETCLMVDPVVNGSAGDLDPAVICMYGNDQNMATAVDSTAANMTATALTDKNTAVSGGLEMAWACWWQKGGASERWSRATAPVLYGQQGPVWPGAAGQNAMTLKDDLLPIVWARRSDSPGPGGYKGISKWLYYNSTLRTTGQAISVGSSTARDYIHASRNIAVRYWNGVYGLG